MPVSILSLPQQGSPGLSSEAEAFACPCCKPHSYTTIVRWPLLLPASIASGTGDLPLAVAPRTLLCVNLQRGNEDAPPITLGALDHSIAIAARTFSHGGLPSAGVPFLPVPCGHDLADKGNPRLELSMGSSKRKARGQEHADRGYPARSRLPGRARRSLRRPGGLAHPQIRPRPRRQAVADSRLLRLVS